jgi:hypothetical protein
MTRCLAAACALLAALGCAPKKAPSATDRVVLPAVYKPLSLTDLNRPLPLSPEPCQIGSRQVGPVITELVACGDRGVSRVMVLPDEAPPPSDMLDMAAEALREKGLQVRPEAVSFPANGRGMEARRLVQDLPGGPVFAGLAVAHPEAPWPELLTCSAPRPVDGLEAWCIAAIQALILPDTTAPSAP